MICSKLTDEVLTETSCIMFFYNSSLRVACEGFDQRIPLAFKPKSNYCKQLEEAVNS
jgi:hypothetical protein